MSLNHIPTILRDVYYDVAKPSSYSSVEKVLDEARKVNRDITRRDVIDYLHNQFPYTLHYPVSSKFKRNKVVSTSPEELFEADLIDLHQLDSSNDGVRYILTVIDVFSKKAYAFPLKTKSGLEVKKAFQRLFDDVVPERLMTDAGTEFLNKHVQQLLKENCVTFYTAKNEKIKCPNIERFQRTIQARIFKYITATSSKRYVDVLSKLVSSYNSTKHSSTKVAPNDVTSSNRDAIFERMYGTKSYRELLKQSKHRKTNLRVGDTVRVARTRGAFTKGYLQNYSDTLYTIIKLSPALGLQSEPLFTLKNKKSNKLLRGRFYGKELVRVGPSVDDYYRPEDQQARDKKKGRLKDG